MIAFSEKMQRDLDQLRAFLATHVYRHRRIARIMDDAGSVVRDLFKRYSEEADALPPEWRGSAPRDTRAYARHICDFIAGMTDRYALAEHRRLFDATPDLR
jgi:dGTPase